MACGTFEGSTSCVGVGYGSKGKEDFGVNVREKIVEKNIMV